MEHSDGLLGDICQIVFHAKSHEHIQDRVLPTISVCCVETEGCLFEQDGDLQQPPNGLSRQGQYSKHSYAPRQPYGLALHDNGIEGKYGREDLGPRGMSEELMGGLYPAEEQHAGSTAGRDPRHKAGHRIFDDAGLGMTPEEMPGGMPRGFAHDDELLVLHVTPQCHSLHQSWLG